MIIQAMELEKKPFFVTETLQRSPLYNVVYVLHLGLDFRINSVEF